MNWLAGVLGVGTLVAAILLGMRGVERGLARLLGLPQFRWFDVRAAPGPAWKCLLVRVTSALVPFALSAAVFTLVYAVGGVPEPTTAVTVLPGGAAQEAGMQSGDRVLVVGSVPVDTWEEARTQIQMHTGPVLITIERSGQRRELSVAPRERRMGVSPISRMRPIGIGDAAWRGIGLPLSVVREAARAFVSWHAVDTGELKGPVAVVSESSKAAKTSWISLLYFLAVMGSYLWPFVAALHVFDGATGWVFRMTLTETDLPEPLLRIARLRFSMQFSLGCWLALLLAEAAAAAGVPGTLLLVALLVPGVWALWPLLWVSARELWSNKSWSLFLVALIPCGAPIMGISVALALRKEERRLRTHMQPNGD